MRSNRMFTVILEVKDQMMLTEMQNACKLMWKKSQNYGMKDCLNGKQARNTIPRHSTWRAGKVLELVHSDICGPISPISNSGKRYCISFIDDYSRKAWVYLLSNKSDAFDCFKNFKAMVEKETNEHICCLRTDRGGEYTSTSFADFCRTHGIKRQLTTTYTPQQNGVAERKNRTVMNMVRSMLSAKEIPKSFWPNDVLWTFHVLNRCPTLSVKNMTPQQAWSGVKPSAHKIIVSKDIIFEEDKKWEWKGENFNHPEDYTDAPANNDQAIPLPEDHSDAKSAEEPTQANE
ncbi:hypothetical protein LIER_28742 [Lithospermum erythrorhizon]|uniref:Integrase catalytic domain-containing protein n=1 Tax=Lithospermum erythrorhizon TaxID=34254 RepID=A0AAV3RMQ0_LITER